MADEKSTPGVVFVCDFVCASSSKFSKYINYIDRDNAVRERSGRLFYDLYADLYMDNDNKTFQNDRAGFQKESALFASNSDFLTLDEKKEIKKLFLTAQKNKSPLWRNILSFDTKFLAENGLFNLKSGLLDEHKLKDITRTAIYKLLKNEKMERSAIWTASIHYNTDNIHIHIALAEPHPTRKKVGYKGRKEYRGKYKPSTLKLVKSVVLNKITNRDKELEKINHIIRKQISASFKSFDLNAERQFRRKLKSVKQNLPKEKRLWQYNMKAVKNVRPIIEDLTDTYIKLYCEEDYKELLKTLAHQEQVNRKLYGKSQNQSYTKTKLDELHTRMGNTVLKFLKSQTVAIKRSKQLGHDMKIISLS